MWPLFYALFTAQAQEPATTGALRVEVISKETWDESWAMVLWKRAVNRLERQWRKAERRSEAPVAKVVPPEPPKPPDGLPIPGTELQLEGMGLKRSCVTAQEGVCLFEDLPPGTYRVVTTKAGFGGITLENIQVIVGRTTSQQITLKAAYDEDIIVTWNQAASASEGPKDPQLRGVTAG